MTKSSKYYIQYLISLFLFGTNGVFAHYIDLPSNQIVFFRSVIGTGFLLVLFFLFKKKITFYKNPDQRKYMILSGIFTAITWLSLYAAFASAGVGLSILIYYVGPVLVMISSPFFFKEKLTLQKILSFTVVALGAFLIHIQAIGGTGGQERGVLFALMAAISYHFMIVFGKKINKVDPLEKTTFQLIIALAVITVYLAFNEGFTIQTENLNWLALIALGLSMGVASYLFLNPLAKLPVQRIAISGYLEPLSAVLLSVLILGESFTPLQVLGGMMIIGGAIFGELQFSKRKE